MLRTVFQVAAGMVLLAGCAGYGETDRTASVPAPAVTASAPGTVGVPAVVTPIPPTPAEIPSAPGTIGVPAQISRPAPPPAVTGTGAGGAIGTARSSDQLFVAQAADGSRREIWLSRLALDRSQNPAVRDFAQQMINQHQQLDQQLAQVASQDGFGLPAQPTISSRQVTQTLSQESGDRFDRDYTAQMVEDHLRALSLFKEAARRATDPNIRAFAHSAVPHLQAHLQRAEELNQTVAETAAR